MNRKRSARLTVLLTTDGSRQAHAALTVAAAGPWPETAKAHPTEAAWLIAGYEPTPASQGVIETLKAGGKPYPMVPTMGLLHTALGDNLIEYLQGRESADQALADATKAYETSAKEAGFIN